MTRSVLSVGDDRRNRFAAGHQPGCPPVPRDTAAAATGRAARR